MNYNALRKRVLHAAREGRATLIPAGARDNATAQVCIDGEVIGQASSLCHFVREDATQGRAVFAERVLVPAPEWALPVRLRTAA